YVATYVERDVRAILNVENLFAFQTFLQLAAGRVAQLVNASALGADAGVTHATARSWLSVLETGYVTWRLPPFHSNLSKRLIKTPKIHFVDTGLACYLLGIQSPAQLRSHPLRGQLFETWVASEVLKSRVHLGLPRSLTFYRDRKGLEVDLIVDAGGRQLAVEAKSGATIAEDFFAGLDSFRAKAETALPGNDLSSFIVYGGEVRQNRSNGTAIPWSELDQVRWDNTPSKA
ncbi:MAG: ATPase (AAA+ superfamily)-like protein, partial [bacterium]